MSSSDRFPHTGALSRNTVIVGGVLALHVAAIWALQTGLLRKAAEIIIPAQVLSEFITPAPPPPPVTPPAPVPPKPAVVTPKPRPAPAPRLAPAPAPMPLAIADPTPAPAAPVGVLEPQPPAPPAPPAPSPAPAVSAPAPPSVVPPSSDAHYLNNPKPAYPAVSRRLGEQGKVVLRVLIGADGQPQKIELKQSSGFERLDQVALDTVKQWRFAPGTRNGQPEAMWNLVPIHFVLQK